MPRTEQSSAARAFAAISSTAERPRTEGGAAARLSSAQLAMLIEGLDWRQAIVHDEVLTPTLA
jgi:hypothetical protein